MRILFVTPRFPLPPIKGDKTLAYNRAKNLKGHSVDLLTLSRPEDSKHLQAAQGIFASVHLVKHNPILGAVRVGLKGLFSPLPFQVLFYEHPGVRKFLAEHWQDYDVVDFFTIRLCSSIPKSARTGNAVVDFIDSMSLNLERRLQGEPNRFLRPVLRSEVRRLKKFERTLVERFGMALLVSESEAKEYRNPKVSSIPLGVACPEAVREDQNTPVLSFHGNMAYFPNVQAVLWFLEHCWSDIRDRIPDAVFRVIGANPTNTIRDAALKTPGVQVTGFVEDMAAELQHSAIAVFPLQSGSGMQNKVLESMAMGIPTVTTNLGRGSIEAEPGREILLAETAEEFVRTTIRLLNDAELRQAVGLAGRRRVQESYSWDKHCQSLIETYKSIEKSKRGAPN